MWLDESSGTISIEGIFRLSTDQYEEMSTQLREVLDTKPTSLTLDLTSLEFLNSSGINVIAKFVIAVRNDGGTKLAVKGSQSIPWQSKSLPNLKKLYSKIDLTIV